jgi:hypothetical protein
MNVKELLKNHLDEQGRLMSLPSKRKLKNAVLFLMASKFEPNRKYGEKEVNQILDEACDFQDAAMLRRELFFSKFLDRKIDGSEYWLRDPQPTLESFDLE